MMRPAMARNAPIDVGAVADQSYRGELALGGDAD